MLHQYQDLKPVFLTNNPIAPGVKLNEIIQTRNLKTDVISNIELDKTIYNKEQITHIRRKLGLIR